MALKIMREHNAILLLINHKQTKTFPSTFRGSFDENIVKKMYINDQTREEEKTQ